MKILKTIFSVFVTIIACSLFVVGIAESSFWLSNLSSYSRENKEIVNKLIQFTLEDKIEWRHYGDRESYTTSIDGIDLYLSSIKPLSLESLCGKFRVYYRVKKLYNIVHQKYSHTILSSPAISDLILEGLDKIEEKD